MTPMLAHGLQVLSDGAVLLVACVAMLVVATLVLRSPPHQLLALSVVALLAGTVLVLLAVRAASQPQPPFDPDFKPTMLALATAPCVIGALGLLLWLRRRKH